MDTKTRPSESVTLQKVIKILDKETKGRFKIDRSTHLKNDLHLDSLGAIRLIAVLEAEFEITFDFTDTPPETVESLAQFIESQLLGH